jgi:hypothetical protein
MKFVILTAIGIMVTFFWHVMPFSVVDTNISEKPKPPLQVTFLQWRRRYQVPPKRWYLSAMFSLVLSTQFCVSLLFLNQGMTFHLEAIKMVLMGCRLIVQYILDKTLFSML